MACVFLFVEYLDDTGCMCVRLEDDASVSASLAHRTFAEIKTLQLGAHTVIVVPTTLGGLYRVDLPWLGDRKAREAIPFALEEQLAQKLQTLHFAFDKAHHQNNQYLVVVMDKPYLQDLIARLDEAGIMFHEITMDWFALHPHEILLAPSSVLLDVETYQGALSFDLAGVYLSKLADRSTVISFTDTPAEWNRYASTLVDDPFLIWVAKRLQQESRLNLCQGEFKRSRQQEGYSQRWLFILAGVAGLWLITALGVNIVNNIRLNHQLNLVDQDIAVIYRQFFPNSERVISPKFRITQLLHHDQGASKTGTLWQLLDKFEKSIKLKDMTIERMDFKSQLLSVTLKARDFSVLDSLGERLKQANVHVAQKQATSHEKYVTAVMELRL